MSFKRGGSWKWATLPRPTWPKLAPNAGKGRAPMLSSTYLFVNGTNETISGVDETTCAGPTIAGRAGQDLFGQYVAAYQSNEFLSSELKSVTQKLARARAYFESPG